MITDEAIEIATAEFLRRHGHDFYKTESSVRVMAAKAVRELLEKDQEIARLHLLAKQERLAHTDEIKDLKEAHVEAMDKVRLELARAHDALQEQK